jgi:outer membrane protein with beta-barrel domain
MLTPTPMTRACLLAAVIVAALVAVGSKSAHAEGSYLGLGVGPAPSLSDDRFTGDGRSVKALGGMRWGQFSVEAQLGGFDLAVSNTVIQGSVNGKLNLPIADGFEVYGRGGLGHSWLRAAKDVNNQEGNGFVLGLGIEYRLDLTVASGAIFLDYGYNSTTFKDDRDRQLDLSTRVWTIGFAVGI